MPARLLSDPLPLRRTTELPEYREDRVIPWVYGRLPITPIPLDADGLLWLLAGHPVAAVTRVEVDGQVTDGWQLVHTVYPAVGTLATLRITQTPKSGAPIVTVVGKRAPDTGALLEHPADIVSDILRECGWSTDPGALDALHRDYPGLAIAGALDAARPIRDALREIMQSIGARWSAAPLDARRADLWPAPALNLTARDLIDPQASSDTTALATVLRVLYAHDPATGQPRAAMTLHAPEAVDLYGSIEADLSLPWLRSARDALATGTAHLQRTARPEWRVQARLPAPGHPLAPGDTVTLDHPWLPTGPALIDRITRDETGTLAIELIQPAGPAPYVELRTRAAALDPTGPEPLTVTYRDGMATFAITDDTGNPIAGASVTLDGAETRTTDRMGRVQFRTARGLHTLTVVAAGYALFEIEVTV